MYFSISLKNNYSKLTTVLKSFFFAKDLWIETSHDFVLSILIFDLLTADEKENQPRELKFGTHITFLV